MQTVRVNLAQGAYDIIIKPSALQEAGAAVRARTGSNAAFVVTDSNVAPHYLDAAMKTLEASAFRAESHIIPAGEQHKTLDQIARLYDALLGGKIDRQGIVIALGGGVVGDMTGFAAATVLRGVPFVQVPTTLLAMVDASVGGKTGIDHPLGKNLIGAFHQPLAVIIDPQTLRTLPPRELRSGLAECIKHEVIRDADGFERLERSIHRALAVDPGYMAELVAHNVAIKARVVEADPFEKGERAHLNYGHTFGHAIETVSNYTLAHGECVALGMVAAARTAHRLRMLDETSVQRFVSLVRAAGLPASGMTLSIDEVAEAMAYDKKVRSGKIRLVLPDRIGHVIIRDDVPAEVIREALASLKE